MVMLGKYLSYRENFYKSLENENKNKKIDAFLSNINE